MIMITSILIRKTVSKKAVHNLLKDRSYKITVPIDWVKILNMTKGQKLYLELKENGFYVHTSKQSKNQEEKKSEYHQGETDSDIQNDSKKKGGHLKNDNTK